MPHLKEAALLEDVADELVQVHQTLVVADVVGEDGEHHGVLRTTGERKLSGKGKGRNFRETQQRAGNRASRGERGEQ